MPSDLAIDVLVVPCASCCSISCQLRSLDLGGLAGGGSLAGAGFVSGAFRMYLRSCLAMICRSRFVVYWGYL